MSTGAGPIERAVIAAFPYLLVGLGAALPLLFVPGSVDRQPLFLLHLGGLVGLGLLATIRLGPLVHDDWYAGQSWSVETRRLIGGITLVVIVTGVVGLVTLATSAALRLQPSLQFLQLLSALDIAWAGAAIIFGVWRRWGRTPAVVGGVLLGIACVTSIWNYLRVVGLGPDDRWALDAGELMRLVLPADMMAATIAIALLWTGMRGAALSALQ
jgi:hypothetical protein